MLFRLQKKTRETAAAAERTTAHSQFFQEVRDIKDKALEAAWQEYFALQKDRRSWGADTTDYTMLYKPSRSVQIREQSARNLEVSILSGIAKHVGFPAAPDMKSLAAAEALADMSKMGVSRTSSGKDATITDLCRLGLRLSHSLTHHLSSQGLTRMVRQRRPNSWSRIRGQTLSILHMLTRRMRPSTDQRRAQTWSLRQSRWQPPIRPRRTALNRQSSFLPIRPRLQFQIWSRLTLRRALTRLSQK